MIILDTENKNYKRMQKLGIITPRDADTISTSLDN